MRLLLLFFPVKDAAHSSISCESTGARPHDRDIQRDADKGCAVPRSPLRRTDAEDPNTVLTTRRVRLQFYGKYLA